jgi:hypothetical protein
MRRFGQSVDAQVRQPIKAGCKRCSVRQLAEPKAGVHRFSTWIEIAGALIIVVGCFAMFSIGAYLVLTDRPTSAALTWGFAFLLVVLLLLAKFKRFKGFGFEAELWEEKQAEAAALVDQMRSLSNLICKQMASIAARVGLWDSALSPAELVDFVDDLRSHLGAIESSPHESEETLHPLYQRLEAEYRRMAREVAAAAFRSGTEDVNGAIDSMDMDRRRQAAELVPKMNQEDAALSKLDGGAISELVKFVESSVIIRRKAVVIDEVSEIERDLAHFHESRSIRRKAWLRSKN